MAHLVSLVAAAGLLMQGPPPILPPTLTGPNFTLEARGRLQRENAEMLLAAAGDPSVPLIPLAPDGSARYGVALNFFLHSRARLIAARDAGRALSIDDVLNDQRRMIDSAVVAFPLHCGGRDVHPVDVAMVMTRGPRAGPAPAGSELWRGSAEIGRHLGGVDAPDGAIARVFVSTLEISNVRVTYDAPACPAAEPVLTFSFDDTTADPDPDSSAFTHLPADAASVPWPAKVRVSLFIDAEGRPRIPVFIDGPAILARAALDYATTFRFKPFRVNGTPVIQSAVLPVVFVGDGKPTARRLSPNDFQPQLLGFTPDAARLSLATSACAGADSETFGFNPAEAIAVGGGADAPRRERAYLESLRGPFGEGVFFSRPVVVNTPDGPFDRYGVTYDRLGITLALFFDPRHLSPEPLRSPPGFTCPSPLPVFK